MNIAQSLEQGQNLAPDKPAVVFEGRPITYQELDEMGNRIANGLSGLGVSRGDRVALFLPNTPYFIAAYYGIQKIGAIVVSMNSALKTNETQFIFDDCGAVAVLTTEALRPNVPVDNLPHLKYVLIAEGEAHGDLLLQDVMAHASPHAQALDLEPDAPAAIFYTSGTTGFPKGVTHAHRNIAFSIRSATDTFHLQSDDRVLLFLPIFHNFGLNTIITPTIDAGATLVLQREFEVHRALQAIADEGVTVLVGVPTIYRLLCDQGTPEQVRTLRLCLSSAARLPLALNQAWYAKYGIAIQDGYGLTESFMVTFNRQLYDKPDAVGLPLAGIEMRIVDAADAEVAPGELGEVVIRSSGVMLAYWNRPAETAEVIREGWLHTGDIGRMDEDGDFYIVDRVKDMINVGGINVYPSEVENVLYEHPAVSEVAVYGVAHQLLGEQVRASIVCKPHHTVTEEDITAFCRTHMADFKMPSGIEFVDELPRGRTGKVLKRVLRDQWQDHVAEGMRTDPAMPANQKAGGLPGESDLEMGAIASEGSAAAAWRQQLAAAPMDERRNLLTSYIQALVGQVLGREDSAAIPISEDFFKLGLKSLTSLELLDRLRAGLGCWLPVTFAYEYTTVDAVVTYLLDTVLTSDASPPAMEADADPPQMSDLADVSQDEIAALLARELAEIEEEKSP